MFETNQRRVCGELKGIERDTNTTPDAEESRAFWNEIWKKSTEHNDRPEWLSQLEADLTSVEKE